MHHTLAGHPRLGEAIVCVPKMTCGVTEEQELGGTRETITTETVAHERSSAMGSRQSHSFWKEMPLIFVCFFSLDATDFFPLLSLVLLRA